MLALPPVWLWAHRAEPPEEKDLGKSLALAFTFIDLNMDAKQKQKSLWPYPPWSPGILYFNTIGSIAAVPYSVDWAAFISNPSSPLPSFWFIP